MKVSSQFKAIYCSAILTIFYFCVQLNAKPTVAVYDLTGEINETGQQTQSMMSLTPGRPLTQLELVLSLTAAAESEEVKAIMLDVDQSFLDLSQVQEIRRLLLKARKAGKEIWLYSEHFTAKSALIGSAATRFVFMPEGDISFRGLYSESYYFKDLLDRIGVQADVIHIGDYKSAGENLYRTGPSPQSQEQEERLLDSIYQQILGQMADGRNLKVSKIESTLSMPNPTPDDLLRAKMVDELSYRTHFVEDAKKHFGDNTNFDRSYKLPNTQGPEVKGMMDLMKQIFKAGKSTKLKEDFIAVVPVEGVITEQSIAQARTSIIRAINNRYAKALVLRVDSPGGSALASELLWETTHTWKSSGRPLIVSMGGLAASGGYYISAGADRIFAEEATITGSIGVVGMKLVTAEAMNKLGIHTHSTQRGKYAGMYSPSRTFTDDEANVIRSSMEDIYKVFLNRVSQGRNKKIQGELQDLAGGRVYSGVDALKIGLVDEIGGLSEAIDWAIAKTGLKNPPIQLSPRPRDGLEAILSPAPARGEDDEFISMKTTSPLNRTIRSSLLDNVLSDTPLLNQRGMFHQFLQQLEAIDNGHVQLFGPQLQWNIN